LQISEGTLVGKNQRVKADLVLFLVAAVWGGGFVAQRAGSQYLGFFVFGAARYILGALVMIPFVRHINIPRRLIPWSILTGVVLFAASALQQAGIETTTAGNAAFITGLYVVIVPILMAIITRKPAPGITWVAAIIAVIGTLLLSTGGSISLASGDALEFAGAFLWASHLILVSKLSPKINVIQFSLLQYVVAGLLNLACGLIFEMHTFAGLPQAWIAIAYAGIISTAIGFTGQIWGQRHAPAADAALILSMEAVFAAISGFLFLFERFSPVQLIGCVLIFGAVIMAQLWPLRKTNSQVSVIELPE
jgi:drug/metabolite transporter (DMT)-like permease